MCRDQDIPVIPLCHIGMKSPPRLNNGKIMSENLLKKVIKRAESVYTFIYRFVKNSALFAGAIKESLSIILLKNPIYKPF